MGTPEFAVSSLDILVQNGYEIVGVITVPDKPAGRGHKLQQSAVKKYALEHNLPVLQPEKLKDPVFIEQLQALNADLQVVVAFRMLPAVVFQMPRYGTFNLHASLLPQYRGAARKAVALAEKSGGGAWGRVSGQVALAETLAFAGQNDEAKKTLGAALGPASNDPGLLVRASALLLVLKDVPGALAHARRAVEVSQGGDAAAHAALGEALAASGDPNGAGTEFARAAELEPENAAFRRRLEAFRPKKGAKAA